jgi:hypothetical protein
MTVVPISTAAEVTRETTPLVVSVAVPPVLVFLVAFVVGFLVWRHTKATSTAVPATGDLGVAFTVGSVTLIALAFLFGVDPTAKDDFSRPAPAPVSTTAPAEMPCPRPLPATVRPRTRGSPARCSLDHRPPGRP